MAPKRARVYYAREANATTIQALAAEVIAKRTKRHLDELERSNYSAPNTLLTGEDAEEGHGRGRARQTISDKRTLNIPGTSPAAKKKKTTHNVRTALVYRKTLAELIDESKIANLPPDDPTYLRAAAPPSAYPPRMLCTVCGYWGHYKCRRCSMAYCDQNCESVHAETRCEKRVM
ncbi:hypothetical protein BDQ12DRAFT_734250 [Crucibulum laeve]|uniref:HIT-type domain-containing protein n=1 Tax=Crucibulum laeve TaxID=68775 RepID=A0A5C3M4A9_9AGAR|nr:hypothetical protein BDQ12DRAFT_734250 [Crucibulum laeve]